MSVMIRILFKDQDIVIPRERLRRVGIRPGDYITISSGAMEETTTATISDRERMLSELRKFWGAWSAEDEERFRQEREEMWRTWQSQN